MYCHNTLLLSRQFELCTVASMPMCAHHNKCILPQLVLSHVQCILKDFTVNEMLNRPTSYLHTQTCMSCVTH